MTTRRLDRLALRQVRGGAGRPKVKFPWLRGLETAAERAAGTRGGRTIRQLQIERERKGGF